MRRNDYPDWLKVHLKKGVYANKTVNGYTLYKAHSVYDPVTKKAKRIHDGVLGTVTKDGGFVPKVSYKVPKTKVTIYTFGIIRALFSYDVLKYFKVDKSLIYFKNEIIVGSILNYLYNDINIFDYDNSILSLDYPNVRFNYLNTNSKITNEVLRNTNKLKSLIDRSFIEQFKYVYLVKLNNNYQVIGITEKLKKTEVCLTYEK